MKKENSIERIAPKTLEWDRYIGNHMSRYKFALDQILKQENKKRILDIACGVGYGTNYLAQHLTTSQFYGVDISNDALTIARNEFKLENIEFVLDDCTNPNSQIKEFQYDIIVSFETLEHLKNSNGFLEFVHSSLAPNGIFIVSTPNRFVTSPNGLEWDFHEVEYSPYEFDKVLSSVNFKSKKFFAQEKSALGEFKSQIIGELNKIKSNPFFRFGRFLQIIKGSYVKEELFENSADYEIKEQELEYLELRGLKGPDVLIAICESDNTYIK